MADLTDIQKDLMTLEADLKRLEAEYNMFFAGRLPRPPWETRRRVENLIKRWDRGYIQGSGDRFRFEALQTRFQKFLELWDRALRAREEGRPGPFVGGARHGRPKEADADGKVLHVAAFRDPSNEMDKLHSLYDSLMAARQEAGEAAVPFHKFAALVTSQVSKLKAAGTQEVAFRIVVKDGRVNFTARGMEGGEK